MIENGKERNILVTGDCGMIGSAVVAGLLSAGYCVVGIDRKDYNQKCSRYVHYNVDLSDKNAIKSIITENAVGRIIHLAALAHARDGIVYTWEDYQHLNVECAGNVFEAAGEIPVLFISTVDVYGFTNGVVCAQTEPRPVSQYAKSKVLAENLCKKLSHYTIYRFSPVYTNTIKRDIQKRYYLKYPNIAYQIGKGSEYEVLNIDIAVNAVVDWCGKKTNNEICIVKDPVRMKTVECIKQEKKAGRAKVILYFPRCMMAVGYHILKALTGENKYTYLLNKAVYPLESK